MKTSVQAVTQRIATELGLEKVMWPRANKACKQCLEAGFTLDDLLVAVSGMKQSDKKYWSIYSIFSKPDYWMAQAPKQQDKGVW